MWLNCLEYAVVPHTVCCAISMKEEIAQTCCNDDILSQYYVPLQNSGVRAKGPRAKTPMCPLDAFGKCEGGHKLGLLTVLSLVLQHFHDVFTIPK